MKRLQSLVAIGIVLSAACYAQHCPDPTQRRAKVGGDTIEGSVSLHQKPLKFSQLRLSSNGKTTWVGATDHDRLIVLASEAFSPTPTVSPWGDGEVQPFALVRNLTSHLVMGSRFAMRCYS